MTPDQPTLRPKRGCAVFAGTFHSFEHWVNKARSWLRGRNAQCFDSRDRRCEIGRDFMRARDEGAFPVRFYVPIAGKGADPIEWPADLRVRQFPEALP